jgi:CRISPR-associated protein Cmr4
MITDTSSTTVKKGLYTQQRFLFMTLDPVHIGAGGYRLGRVDMTITREPGTNLPKVPGTSLAGAARSYAAMRYGKPEAAGQHKKLTGAQTTCPIIYTFGTATDTGGRQGQSDSVNQAGTVSIGDAHILFFPVNSMAGPVWVGMKEKVTEAWGQQSVKLPQSNGVEIELTDDKVVTSLKNWDKELNLGWLLFTSTQGLEIEPPVEIQSHPEWKAIAGRIVLVTQQLFSQIINSNLEVRTSVSINPETGAAEQGALFTYEAIPRATWLWCDVVEDDYKTNGAGTSKFPPTDKQCKRENGTYIDNAGESLGEIWTRPIDVVKSGIKLVEYLGIGGMGTRGFGRMRCVADWEASDGGIQ